MYIAQLECKRIQTFLFASSRLRDMVAANALLGHTLRIELVKAAINNNSCSPEGTTSPLTGKTTGKDTAISDWSTTEMFSHGILSRDGGHFYALFPDKKKAESFITVAHSILQENLPGIAAEYAIFEHNSPQSQHCFTSLTFTQPPELPIFARCQQSGHGAAEKSTKRLLNDTKLQPTKRYISRITSKKNEHFYNTFKKAIEFTSGDYASEQMQQWVEDEKSISDFDALAGSDYLAVISADGNNMGARFKQYLNKKDPNHQASFIDNQKCAEAFFSSARNALKTATQSALNNTFDEIIEQNKPLPFHLLMLGGDDLLLVCRAKQAHKLVQAIDTHLQQHPIADDHPLTMAYGIAIASYTLPFYRLYHCAEALNASAKVLARSQAAPQNGIQPSGLDWQIVTQSWIDDPIAERKKHKIVRYREQTKDITLLLTQKPYLLANNTPDTESPFARLNTLAKALTNPNKADKQQKPGSGQEDNAEPLFARNQLLKLQASLPKGRLQSDYLLKNISAKFQLNDLSEEVRKAWEQCFGSVSSAEAFSLLDKTENNHPYCYTTPLGDLIELIELQYLQRENTPDQDTKESNG
ncbi:hypothetical protein C942_03232 [Photobacterium marinum]|uniref:Cas10/Cmr2 second palm domain-containing protein n=1 Tax=Photobacterium marinum TaxID=1056511 RepID=L8J6S0_9GAMM|nr:hypothetical protein [Photobacterium marinum]ELR63888.1 hypothetical protein C942_03232 [Photobacterium marinum]